MLENDYEFSCPYCGEMLAVRVDATAGQKQDFVYDCEVCCKPISIRVVLDGDEVIEFHAGTDE